MNIVVDDCFSFSFSFFPFQFNEINKMFYIAMVKYCYRKYLTTQDQETWVDLCSTVFRLNLEHFILHHRIIVISEVNTYNRLFCIAIQSRILYENGLDR